MQPAIILDEFQMNALNVSFEHINKEEAVLEQLESFDYRVLRHNDDEYKYKLDFTVGIAHRLKDMDDNKSAGYQILASISGFFTFPEDAEFENREYLIRVNGAAILYGILRGEIANVTGSFPAGKFLLPTVMMEDVIKHVDEQKFKEKKESRALADDKSESLDSNKEEK